MSINLNRLDKQKLFIIECHVGKAINFGIYETTILLLPYSEIPDT